MRSVKNAGMRRFPWVTTATCVIVSIRKKTNCSSRAWWRIGGMPCSTRFRWVRLSLCSSTWISRHRSTIPNVGIPIRWKKHTICRRSRWLHVIRRMVFTAYSITARLFRLPLRYMVFINRCRFWVTRSRWSVTVSNLRWPWAIRLISELPNMVSGKILCMRINMDRRSILLTRRLKTVCSGRPLTGSRGVWVSSWITTLKWRSSRIAIRRENARSAWSISCRWGWAIIWRPIRSSGVTWVSACVSSFRRAILWTWTVRSIPILMAMMKRRRPFAAWIFLAGRQVKD